MHPWNITKEQLLANTTHLDAIAIRELVWAYNYSSAKSLSYTEFGAAANISGDTLRKLATGTYVDPRASNRRLDMPDAMPFAIAALRESVARTAPTTVQFVSTETSRRIADNCNLARESGSPMFLQGASHIGKTTALKKIRDSRPGDTWLITVTSGMAAKGLAVAACEELGISSNGNLATLTRRIGRAIPSTGLLIIDDFHVLTLSSTPRTFLAAMEFLRAVYDYGNCGMLFSTTDLDYTKIQKDFRNALHQLMRRGVHKPHLGSQPQQKDVRAIIEAHGLKWPARSLTVSGKRPWQVLASLAVESGLKVITERLRYALRIAAKQSAPVTWEDFILADTAILDNSKAPENDWV